MKTDASPSLRHLARIIKRRMVWDGSASMSTCSYSSRSGYRNSRCWSRHNSKFRSTQISLTTHMAERSPLLLCILPTKGMSFVFATHCLLIFVHPCVLCMLKAQSTYVSKTTLVVDAQRFVWNSKRKFWTQGNYPDPEQSLIFTASNAYASEKSLRSKDNKRAVSSRKHRTFD